MHIALFCSGLARSVALEGPSGVRGAASGFYLALASALLIACGDPDGKSEQPDGAMAPDSTMMDDAEPVDAAPELRDARAPVDSSLDDAARACGSPCKASWECGSAQDDCNVAVSCGVCSGGELCSDHRCVAVCTGCTIDGICIAEGGAHPNDPCKVCQVASSRSSWSARADGVACADGDVCTLFDHCQAGVCLGTARPCDDGVACNGTEACDAISGFCRPGLAQCGEQICSTDTDSCEPSCERGCLIAGVCYAPGATNPANDCQVCTPSASRTSWQLRTGLSCGQASECLPPGVCRADATCQQVPLSSLTACGTGATTCLRRHCDGQGACIADPAALGTTCGATAAICDLQDTCDGLGACVDRGVAPTTQSCGGVGSCNGLVSAPACSCPAGYRLRSSGVWCMDIDECEEQLDSCDDAPQACVNQAGGFACSCPAAFEGDGLGELGCACPRPDYSPLCQPWSSVSPALWTHGCAISAGALFCWGGNEEGQLGTGDKRARSAPTRVGTNADWQQVSVGRDHTCGLRSGALYCWGNPGWIGRGGNPLLPGQVGTDADWSDLGTGLGATCGLRNQGEIHCWGYGSVGGGKQVAAPLIPVSGFEGLAVGFTSACAIRNGSLYCWGANTFGELGDGTTTDRSEPVRVGTLTDWVHVDTNYTTCAVRANGEVHCWGNGFSTVPAQVAGVSGAHSVAAGAGYACARLADGTGTCWGYGSLGTLGTLDWSLTAPPTPLTPVGGWQTIEAARYNACGLRDGGLYCWGENERGARGTGPDFGRVGSASDWSHVSLGLYRACGLRGAGDLYCWGNPFGLGLPVGRVWEPRAIGAGSRWLDVSVGGSVSCAIRDPGELYCWGESTYGALGLGAVTNQTTPTRVGTASDWTRVSASWFHVCAVRGDGDLYCWGLNDRGQLGDGSTSNRNVPTVVSLLGWSDVAAGHNHTCGVRGNQLACWGDASSGQLNGTVSSNPQTRPLAVGTGAYESLTAGRSNSCAVRDGRLFCWGSNLYGQMGNGTTGLTIYAPTPVGSAGDWSAVGNFSGATCGIRGGEAWCWGNNDHGELASADFLDRNVPERVGQAGDWQRIAVGNDTACGIRAGALYCWGKNEDGVLGHPAGLLPTLVLDPNEP